MGKAQRPESPLCWVIVPGSSGKVPLGFCSFTSVGAEQDCWELLSQCPSSQANRKSNYFPSSSRRQLAAGPVPGGKEPIHQALFCLGQKPLCHYFTMVSFVWLCVAWRKGIWIWGERVRLWATWATSQLHSGLPPAKDLITPSSPCLLIICE